MLNTSIENFQTEPQRGKEVGNTKKVLEIIKIYFDIVFNTRNNIKILNTNFKNIEELEIKSVFLYNLGMGKIFCKYDSKLEPLRKK